MQPAKIVAEIGCNHKGDLEIAKKMVAVAAQCGAHYAKFQKRTPRELLSEEEYDSPHPVPYNSFGRTYGEHREFLEFTIEQHRELKAYCDCLGIRYACSVWDVTSTREILSLNPDYIKIPSAMNLCKPIYDAIVAANYRGDIHVSLGMTTGIEEDRLIYNFREWNWLERVVLYHCVSAYPTPFEDLRLWNIRRLIETYRLPVGYSGHHLGIAVDVAAFVMGAQWIERHFTLDRTWKGTDHAASLEPTGLGKVVRDVAAVARAMSGGDKQTILPIEIDQRKKLKKMELPCRPSRI